MGKLLDDEHGIEECRAGASPLIGDFDSHDAEVEETGDQVLRHRGVVVHLLDQRPDFFVGEIAHALLKHLLFFGEESERRAGGNFQGFGGHRRII